MAGVTARPEAVLSALAALRVLADADGARLARLLRLDMPTMTPPVTKQGRGAPDDVRPEGRDAGRMAVSSHLAPPRIAGAAAFSAG